MLQSWGNLTIITFFFNSFSSFILLFFSFFFPIQVVKTNFLLCFVKHSNKLEPYFDLQKNFMAKQCYEMYM